MALTLGIIGFSKSGKTTVFNILTHGHAETSAYGSAATPNLGTVKVPDKRLEVLTEMFIPKKTTYATVEYTDVAGMNPGATKQGQALPGLNYIQKVQALVHVVRAFEDTNIPHPSGKVDPIRDIETMDLELAFSDLSIIEKRLIKLEENIKKFKSGPERDAYVFEQEIMVRLNESLSNEIPIRDLDLNEDELKVIRGYQFLSQKPLLTILNLGEEKVSGADQLLAELRTLASKHKQSGVEALRGKIEMEVSQLEPEEAEMFMEELGIKESSLDRIIKASYDLLGLISFLTAGADEVRAWTIRKNTPAVQAAGEIHSDIEKGFIRGEIVSYDDLIKAGSMTEAKRLGVYRSEGKTYIMQDGDIVNFLFNVKK
ncbi:redox-regulated ATPase YchF [Candidatus Chlorohelix sp.]|uniref:redox-regulated ATPase YchF n=1 Tax=Candidatus Chlorohelix sp. TaxID=3139201 RepID=UPI00302B0806